LPHWSLPPVCRVQVQEVVGLQQHVAELGEADAVLPLQAGADRFLGDHIINREVLAGIPQEIHQVERKQPVGVIDQPGRVAFDLKVEQVGQLWLDRFDVGFDLLAGEQLPLVNLAARVADHARTAARQGNGVVPTALQARYGNQGHQGWPKHPGCHQCNHRPARAISILQMHWLP
jgi:hypothetical protein